MSDKGSIAYTVHVHKEGGSYWAEIVELPGAFAAGDTLDELWESVREAVSVYLSAPGSTVRVQFEHESEAVVEQRFLVCS